MNKPEIAVVDSRVWQDIARLRGDQAQRARTVVTELEHTIARRGLPRKHPLIQSRWSDDGGLIIDWRESAQTLGLVFEVDSKESGWYFATTTGRGDSGYLNSLNIEALVQRMAPH